MARMLQENVVTYKTPALAHLFHSFPHLNVSGHHVNSAFAPWSELYLESLGILGSIPSVWLIITMFLLLIYLMTRCCDRKPRPRHSIVVLKWTLAIFTVLSCGAVGVSLYGNDDLHNGVVQFLTSARALDDLVISVKNQTSDIEILLQVNIHDKLTNIGDIIDSPVANLTARGQIVTALSTLVGNAASTLTNIRGISNSLRGVNLTPFIDDVYLMETIRWPLTMGVLSILLVFCVILLFGVARHSRCALIMFSVFGLFAVIISWLTASIYLTAAVALGDFCMNPNEWLERDWTPSSLRPDTLSFYTTCEGSNNPTGSTRTNPFSMAIRQASTSVDATNYQLDIVTRLATTLYPPSTTREDMPLLLQKMRMDVENAARMVSALPASLECRQIHVQYNRALHASCDLALFGLALMLLASVVSGIFFTILVWLDSHTWIYIRKKQDYAKAEERDPFLGRPGSTASSSQSHGHQMSTLTRNQGPNKTCGSEYNDEVSSSEKILRWLTDPCRYDKTVAPGKLVAHNPIVVSTRIHVYHLTSVYPRNLDFKVRILLQFRWKDVRLAFDNLAPMDSSEVVCQKGVLERIWLPNVYIANEKHSLTVADMTEDLMVTVLPDGTVMLSVRLKTSVFCWVKLGRFPFDRQQCHLIMETWRYDTTQLVLEWEVESPVTAALNDNSWVPYLTEYKLLKIIPHSSEHYVEPISLDPTSTYRYTSLTLTFLLAREYGFYIMDYYVPGILLVTISWVSFWMAPDATPARVAIGTSTMLTYFQLGVDTGSKLPNVSYIRSNDLWFIVCTAFIFLSLAEFAFVNTIWRYGCHPVKLKSKSNKQMFKSSIKASKMSKGMVNNDRPRQTIAAGSLFLDGIRLQNNGTSELNVELPYTMEMKAMGKVKFKVSEESARHLHGGLTTTAQQISIWIDEKSRIVFPASFILFNAVYWSLLWV